MEKSGSWENLKIVPWYDGETYDPRALRFELEGRRFADPDELAGSIEGLIGELGGKA
jgi:hypothetical protein